MSNTPTPNPRTGAKRFRVLIYKESQNLGDAVQTIAMSRLLDGELLGVYRDEAARPVQRDVTFVVNGFLSNNAPQDDPNCLFAGVFVGYHPEQQIGWIRSSRFRVGARDPFSRDYLKQQGIDNTFIGCATSTFERYEGKRSGTYSVNVEMGGTALTNHIAREMPWPEQWKRALERLEVLKTAELVYTNRLHVALPCLAFGTPVHFPRQGLEDLFYAGRLSILDALGLEYDRPFTKDVRPFAANFKKFLGEQLGTTVVAGEPKMPVAVRPG